MSFPLDRARVATAEEALGRQLPDGYRSSMMRSNGGCVHTDVETWWLYPILDDSDPKRFKRSCNDIVRETKAAADWPGFPELALAIAHNGSGDYLVLMPSEDGRTFSDAVFLWDHESASLTQLVDAFSALPWTPG